MEDFVLRTLGEWEDPPKNAKENEAIMPARQGIVKPYKFMFIDRRGKTRWRRLA